MACPSIPLPAIAVNRPAIDGPVVVSIPHAGRIYPSEILAAARVSKDDLERLEDSWCDVIAAKVRVSGATVVQAMWARAVADCNRGEGQMAPGEVAPMLRAQFSAPGRKERAGLGVVPTRLSHCGPLWRRPLDWADLEWRLDRFYRPYHAALANELAAARERFGRAILVDLHSMPPIPPGQSGHGARLIVGDRHGATANPDLVERVIAAAARLGEPVGRNQPYAGGHIVRTHGRPAEGVDAVQIEIDRTLYLGSDRYPDAQRAARLAQWFSELVVELAVGFPGDDALPLAAE